MHQARAPTFPVVPSLQTDGKMQGCDGISCELVCKTTVTFYKMMPAKHDNIENHQTQCSSEHSSTAKTQFHLVLMMDKIKYRFIYTYIFIILHLLRKNKKCVQKIPHLGDRFQLDMGCSSFDTANCFHTHQQDLACQCSTCFSLLALSSFKI